MKNTKKIIMLFAILLVNVAFSQTITEVVSVDTALTKTNLYSNALSFFALEFKSANDVIQMKDAETGKVIGKGIVDGRAITIGISCKDSKYKYDIDIAPYQSDIDIIFNTTTFGYWKSCKSIGKIKWINGQITIPVSQVFLVNRSTFGNINYNGDYPAGMRKGYEKWKADIDIEITDLLKKYSDMSNPAEARNKQIIDSLISDLKKEMIKKSNW